MSLLDAIFGQRAVLYDQETRDKIYLGVLTNESHSRGVEVSSYPIESRSGYKGEVSDHVQPSPDTFSIEVILNDPHIASIANLFDTSVEEKILQLDWWMREGILLVYSGPLFGQIIEKIYQITSDNLVITQFNISRSVEDGTAIKAALSFQKVTIVKARMADIKLPQAAKTAAQKGTGATSQAEVTNPKPEVFYGDFGWF